MAAKVDFAGAARLINEVANQIPKTVNDAKKELAREIVKNLVPATPVLTGKARSNWIVTSAAPFQRTNEPPQISIGGAPSFDSLERALLTVQPGATIYIRNNLPYIKRLNEGYSRQAPAKYVESVVSVAQAKFPSVFARVLTAKGL